MYSYFTGVLHVPSLHCNSILPTCNVNCNTQHTVQPTYQPHFNIYRVFQKSDAKIEITITASNLIRIKHPLSSFNYHLSGANVANFNKNHCKVFEQQLFKKFNSKTEVSNMDKSPYQFVRNITSYSLCSEWSPVAQTFACLLCRPYVLCCWRISCLQTL